MIKAVRKALLIGRNASSERARKALFNHKSSRKGLPREKQSERVRSAPPMVKVVGKASSERDAWKAPPPLRGRAPQASYSDRFYKCFLVL